MKLFQNASYRFIENRQKAYIVSAVVLAVGVGAMLFNVATIGSWQNYGVDFEGGSLVQVQFNTPVEAGGVNVHEYVVMSDLGLVDLPEFQDVG